jgi:SAM-dependent methyltransferase
VAAVPRPPAKSRAAYYGGAVLDRATTFRPLALARERATAVRAIDPKGPAPDGFPFPPARLRVGVIDSSDAEAFLSGGAEAATLIRELAADAGHELTGQVLDFGCGCGRVARHWAGMGLDLHGCDYNPALVRWCRENLPFMDARVNTLEPPSPYRDRDFDLVYAISILTHLTERVAHAWMREWRRILKPGGVLLFTTHGDAFKHQLGKRARVLYDAGEMVVKGARVEGMNACVTNHPYRFVTERLLDGYELAGFRPAPSPTFPQDVYVARRA